MEGSIHRPASNKEAPSFISASHRALSADSFARGADVYERIRPGYPKEVSDLLGLSKIVLDIGAGTGQLTRDLPGRVFAIDPSPEMAAALSSLPSVYAWRAKAEATGLIDDSVDAVTCAQTWHWVDTETASAELDRIVRPGGKVLLVWNTLDVSHPWVLRLARIAHSGDIQREGFYPVVDKPWTLVKELRTTFVDYLRADELHALMHTRSYWLRSGEKIRQRMTDNLNWYLYERLKFTPEQLLALPYRTDAFMYSRR